MPILQQFKYTWTPGATQIKFYPWLATLSQEEQDEFRLADLRQKEFREEVINQGQLIVNDTGYIWKDQDALNTGEPTDPTWQIYWTRWINETGVQFTTEHIET
jgi:hypothetical protein